MTTASPVIDLSGAWSLRRDHGNVGLAEDWPRELFEPDRWKPTTLPGPWQRAADFGPDYHYLGWYRRSITIPNDWRWRRTLLRFEAVATDLQAWIDGAQVGGHVGDYVPFEFDISDHVAPGAAIDITLRVDELLGHITKGFHDMLSLHHGGVWRPVTLVGCGRLRVRPNGVMVRGDAETGAVAVVVELDRPAESAAALRARITDADGARIAGGEIPIERGASNARLNVEVTDPIRWTCEQPTLYRANVELRDNGALSDARQIRFGFRSVRAVGGNVRLNGSPLHIRGVLHWGHEPQAIAPAPSQEQVRREFKELKARGFNCVCLCMWYPPRYYYEIADEVGMLLWQEHPVWHSPMRDDLVPEYQRLYTEFMRRDRNHPSVIIVSGTCEHPCFHPGLADWWWKTAHETLSDKLLQVQTAFFAWQNPEQTDLHDEHTYDNNDRWPAYLRDVQSKLRTLPEKPFIMGESVVFSSWPDTRALTIKLGDERPWWSPQILDQAIALEAQWRERYGEETVERFRRQADRHHLLGRKFQIERFRAYPNFAGLVMNHLRDVPQGTFGFKDDLERWRFNAMEMRPWLCNAPLLLSTPAHRRCFASGEATRFQVELSNFSTAPFDGGLTVECTGAAQQITTPITCDPGEVSGVDFPFHAPAVDGMRRITLSIRGAGLVGNSWDLWIAPLRTSKSQTSRGLYRTEGLPFTEAERAPDEVERGYSRGFGLSAESWIQELQTPTDLLPESAGWPHDAPVPGDARVIVTHRLTRSLVRYIECGGRAVLLAHKNPGGLGASYEWFFGQCPLVIERGPLAAGDSDWIVDLLGHDLTRRYARMIPTERLDLLNEVEPIVRLVYVHDQVKPRLFDMLFSTRVGAGLLIVSAFDHRDPAGLRLLDQVIAWAMGDEARSEATMSVERLERFAIDYPTTSAQPK